MADKVSWSELRRLLAQRTGVSEKEANAFLNALNAQIIEALKQDKQVKINGLGTFRLQSVAPRRSVNISSGESITIAGYNKLAFTPEAGVKELIGKDTSPQPAPEGKGDKPAEQEIDPLQKLGTQAEEIVDILADLGQSPEKKEKGKVKGERKKEDATLQDGADAPTDERLKDEGLKVAEPEQVKVTESIVESQEVLPSTPRQVESRETKKRKYHFLRDTLICVVCLLFVLLIGYFFLRHQLTGWIESLGQDQPVQTEQVEPVAPVATDTIAAEEPAAEPVEVAEEKPYERLITTEPMHEASRLTWMAKRYYGSKAYWPYLYDANRDRISNPNRIKVGTPIRVPALTAEQLDTTIATTRARLERLTREAEEACRR